MTYGEALDYILSRRKFQKSSSHERIRRLLFLLGDPHKKLRFVHVVGTNGKGSVSTALSFILTQSGYKTGLFTSPYIIKFNERIKVDEELIPDEQVSQITAMIKEKTDIMEAEELYPTVFEVTTALAMVYFAKSGCDIVILEAGIGGKNDSTNVIEENLLSVITSVSLDHTEMLGETVEQIAKEKCGVIKKGSPMISYPFEGEDFGFIPQSPEAARVIKEQCREKGSRLYVPDIKKLQVTSESLFGTDFIYDGLAIRVNLCGKHQIANMITVIECAKALRSRGLALSDESIKAGIAAFNIPGRTEVISKKPLIILDGGHNEGCMKALKETVNAFLGGRKITLLCSFMRDKDYEKSLSLICPLCDNAVFTCTDAMRGEKAEVLKAVGERYCKNTYACDDVKAAFSLAADKAQGDVVIVCGSFYLVSEVRAILQSTTGEKA